MAEIVLTNVHKVYGHVVAVKDINLAVKDREFVVLVGPSGCGKSTTLRMIAGLEEISGGTIAIGGRVVNHLQPKDRDIAMVFQNYALYQHMSVRDNLAFGLRNRRVPEAEIAAAVSHAARILSIEPLSNLDAQLRAQMRLELKELRLRVPTTSIFVTHDQVEAMTLGDRIVVMKEGLIQQVGTPLELYRKPANRFVASFIGSPAMNFFDLTVAADGDRFALAGEGLGFTLPARRFPRLGACVGRLVCVGMRPQHLRLGAPQNDGQIALKGTLMVTEQLGDEQLLAVRIGGSDIRIAGIDPDLTLAAGSGIEAA